MGINCRRGHWGNHLEQLLKKDHQWALLPISLRWLVGSTIGQAILGTWGPSLAGMAIVPSIIGAVILVAIVSWILGRK